VFFEQTKNSTAEKVKNKVEIVVKATDKKLWEEYPNKKTVKTATEKR
jgi:hypothetical protein